MGAQAHLFFMSGFVFRVSTVPSLHNFDLTKRMHLDCREMFTVISYIGPAGHFSSKGLNETGLYLKSTDTKYKNE